MTRNYPPVGGFMLAWEWGEFQKDLGRKVERYFVTKNGEPVAAFALIHFPLPRGYKYAYLARGPVLANEIIDKPEAFKIFEIIRGWARSNLNDYIFLRLEPPFPSIDPELLRQGYKLPSYYIQPKQNHVVSLLPEDIPAGFHPSTRSNINRAEKRGVSVELSTELTADEYAQFSEMMRETNARNAGKNVYPGDTYFQSFFSRIPKITNPSNPNELQLGIFKGFKDGKLAAINMVLFFGRTATYIYGASYSEALSSKITTYLHWKAIEEAKRRGFKYYDIGGIDEKLWPSLTAFKRQFRGEDIVYIGNLDLPLSKIGYLTYNLLRRLKR